MSHIKFINTRKVKRLMADLKKIIDKLKTDAEQFINEWKEKLNFSKSRDTDDETSIIQNNQIDSDGQTEIGRPDDLEENNDGKTLVSQPALNEGTEEYELDGEDDHNDGEDDPDNKKLFGKIDLKKHQRAIRLGLVLVVLYFTFDFLALYLEDKKADEDAQRSLRGKQEQARKRKMRAEAKALEKAPSIIEKEQAPQQEAKEVVSAVKPPADNMEENPLEAQIDIPPETNTQVLKNDNSNQGPSEKTIQASPSDSEDKEERSTEVALSEVGPTSEEENETEIQVETESELESKKDAGSDVSNPDSRQEAPNKDTDTHKEEEIKEEEMVLNNMGEDKLEAPDELSSSSEPSTSSESDALSDKIVENYTTYVKAPTYKRRGRGLVYNCKGKHWACVDKFSYFTCYENSKYNEQHKMPQECHVKDVYKTLKDCETVQEHYINTVEPVDFCKK